jgi:hypothetical protein
MSTCSFCNKPYKSRGALIKHAAKCTARIENITADIVEPPPTKAPVTASTKSSVPEPVRASGPGPIPVKLERPAVSREEANHDFTENARRDFREQIQSLMSSKYPPQSEPISNENITVNAKAFDCLTKAFVSELFDYQHNQFKTIIGHNNHLAEENKMLISVLRTLILMKHNDGTLGDYDLPSDEDEPSAKKGASADDTDA